MKDLSENRPTGPHQTVKLFIQMVSAFLPLASATGSTASAVQLDTFGWPPPACQASTVWGLMLGRRLKSTFEWRWTLLFWRVP